METRFSFGELLCVTSTNRLQLLDSPESHYENDLSTVRSLSIQRQVDVQVKTACAFAAFAIYCWSAFLVVVAASHSGNSNNAPYIAVGNGNWSEIFTP